MIPSGSVGNKFEFITIAAERCKQLQRGARPKIETNALKPVTIAQQEVLAGVIDYNYGPFPEEYQGEAEVAEVTTEAYAPEETAAGASEQGA
ncbi:MAG: DNA-directed RNA polymerase subunit omega [Acidobacteria bacterium]|nr:MAG: DNA-directed RNA polymerase subunit omega [Acidobacteriota bacterium]